MIILVKTPHKYTLGQNQIWSGDFPASRNYFNSISEITLALIFGYFLFFTWSTSPSNSELFTISIVEKFVLCFNSIKLPLFFMLWSRNWIPPVMFIVKRKTILRREVETLSCLKCRKINQFISERNLTVEILEARELIFYGNKKIYGQISNLWKKS